jgi:putative membrane protein
MHMFYDGGFFMGGMHALWWLFWVVLIGLLIYYAWAKPRQQGGGANETPHELLRRRLASGDITTAEYEERKALLDRDAGRKP